ncbi:MAG: PTS sugar transporter subunit IIA, partial [Kiritimatiellae bacterium]|nr:PTS sugar transporter subunit IIA [Kiritimatiellia bacterium]
PDAEPVHHVFFLASSTVAEDIHVQILAQIARAMARPDNRIRLAEAKDAPELFAALQAILSKSESPSPAAA